MKTFTALLLASLSLLAASCAHLEPALSPAAKPRPETAVLYGRLVIDNHFAYKNKLALWLKNEDTGHSLYLYFDPAEPLYGIRVKPGRYRLAGYVALNRTHEIKHRQPTARPLRGFNAPAGQAVYLGDFTGEASWDGMIFTWGITGQTNQFTATTTEFRQKYPRYADWLAKSSLGPDQPLNHQALHHLKFAP
jgi:hypothetical protein